MIQNGQTCVPNLDYRPAGGDMLDIEIFSVASLRQRVGPQRMRLPRQYAFGMLLFMSKGQCTQWVDFKPVSASAGSLIALSPGQVHAYGNESDWDGWILMCRPEISGYGPQRFNWKIKELTQKIPVHLILNERDRIVVEATIGQMKEDATAPGGRESVNMLLLHQFSALLLRLSLRYGPSEEAAALASITAQRYNAFKDLLEENYARWHLVALYARRLGCSEKSLNRAAVEVTGVTAKNIIAARVALEARRLLVSSTLPVALVAERLGFDEPTNFIKFFKRQATCTPGEFRRSYRALNPAS